MDENGQLGLFDPPIDRTEEENNAVIDRALNFVENQYVLRQLLAGKSWKEAFGGPGGSSHPVMWQADAKGIAVHWATENERLIKPAKILERAKLYQPVESKPEKPISPYSPRNLKNPF